MIWFIFVVIIIQKYKFIGVSVDTIYRDLIENIDSLVILFDYDYKIKYMNKTADISESQKEELLRNITDIYAVRELMNLLSEYT